MLHCCYNDDDFCNVQGWPLLTIATHHYFSAIQIISLAPGLIYVFCYDHNDESRGNLMMLLELQLMRFGYSNALFHIKILIQIPHFKPCIYVFELHVMLAFGI